MRPGCQVAPLAGFSFLDECRELSKSPQFASRLTVPANRTRLKIMRVLVVEDDDDLRRLVVQALRENQYAVDDAADGHDGLYKATTWEYDAIVLDLMLPRIPGLELLRRLRKTHQTPVLILSARDTMPDRVEGLDQGADDYLVKPFGLPELLARLRALIRRAAGKGESVIEIGEIRIDTRTRTVTRNSDSVPLTAREYSLVELLTLRGGELVTRTQIYDHLFDENDDTLSNLVEVHVSNVRKKLGKQFIETRRGQGYIVNLTGQSPASDSDEDDLHG
jgi:two-component system OmpR family response regulator